MVGMIGRDWVIVEGTGDIKDLASLLLRGLASCLTASFRQALGMTGGEGYRGLWRKGGVAALTPPLLPFSKGELSFRTPPFGVRNLFRIR